MTIVSFKMSGATFTSTAMDLGDAENLAASLKAKGLKAVVSHDESDAVILDAWRKLQSPQKQLVARAVQEIRSGFDVCFTDEEYKGLLWLISTLSLADRRNEKGKIPPGFYSLWIDKSRPKPPMFCPEFG